MVYERGDIMITLWDVTSRDRRTSKGYEQGTHKTWVTEVPLVLDVPSAASHKTRQTENLCDIIVVVTTNSGEWPSYAYARHNLKVHIR